MRFCHHALNCILLLKAESTHRRSPQNSNQGCDPHAGKPTYYIQLPLKSSPDHCWHYRYLAKMMLMWL